MKARAVFGHGVKPGLADFYGPGVADRSRFAVRLIQGGDVQILHVRHGGRRPWREGQQEE